MMFYGNESIQICGAERILVVEPERLDRKTYPSFGECIYCGAKAGDVQLTDEHIVPYSLGGNAIIKQGSCKACAAITAGIEEQLGRVAFKSFRNSFGEQTRRPKERLIKGSFEASINKGPLTTFTVPIESLPYFTILPIWRPPGLLQGIAPQREFNATQAHGFYWVPQDLREILGLAPTDTLDWPYPQFKLDQIRFGRAIAKICYCMAVIRWGLRGFRRLVLPDLILGKYPMVPYFVGSPHETLEPPMENRVKHALTLGINRTHGIPLIVAELRLYADSGTEARGIPTFSVVVGAAPRGGWLP